METNPYAASYEEYWSKGWPGVLPLPHKAKAPVPAGYTGRDGRLPSFADMYAWAEDGEPHNIALRLPPGILGIDVDNYGDKLGKETLDRLEAELGMLPPTVRSSSREDGVSGIYLFRVPGGLSWPGELGPNIEVVRFEHRYAVCSPSIHPGTNRPYMWLRGGRIVEIPAPTEIPELPHEWIDHFTGFRTDRGDAKMRGLEGSAASLWLDEREGNTQCHFMAQILAESLLALPQQGSRHEWALTTINRIVWNAGEGHTGAWLALAEVWKVFADEVMPDRGEHETSAEFERMVIGAIAIAVGRFPVLLADPCLFLSPTPPTLAPSELAPSSATEDPIVQMDAFEQLIQLEEAKYRARLEAQWRVEEQCADQFVKGKRHQLELQDRAKREHHQLSLGVHETPTPISLDILLARELGVAEFRVEGLWPKEGRVVLAASAKTGKSTVVTNLVRSLADGTPFLGVFPVRPVQGTIVVIDNELDPRQIQRNYARMNVSNPSKVVILPFRGSVGSFDITSHVGRAEWAKVLRDANAEIVILDCLRPLMDALGLNENTDAGKLLVAFDALLREAGVTEGLVVHHMGHSGERSRGDTRIRDWPDAEWKLVRVADDRGNVEDQGDRFFSAFGRDVSVSEGKIDWDEDTYDVRLVGGSRKESKEAPLRASLIGCLRRTGGGLTQNNLVDAMAEYNYSMARTRAALKSLVADGTVYTKDGPNRSKLHYLSNQKEITDD